MGDMLIPMKINPDNTRNAGRAPSGRAVVVRRSCIMDGWKGQLMVKHRWLMALGLIGVLPLAGCFRQADDGFQPVLVGANPTPVGQAAPGDPPPIIFEVTPDDTTPTPQAVSPFEEITTDEPTPDDPAGLPFDDLTDPVDDATDDEPPAFLVTVPPTDTPAPTLTPEPADATGEPMFITPGAPIAPVALETRAPDTADPAEPPGEPTPEPTSTPSGLITPTSLFELDDECVYIVRGGDTLYRIAINNRTTVAALRRANPQITGDLIRPGQRINLPDCDTTPTPAPAVQVTSTPTAPVEGIEYIVRPGDTLFLIAQRFGTTVSALAQANNLSNPNVLRIGQRLIIPQP